MTPGHPGRRLPAGTAGRAGRSQRGLEATACIDYSPYMDMLRRVVLLPVTTTGAATLVLSLATAPGAYAAPGLAADAAAAAARAAVVRPGAWPARGLDISS